MHSGTTPIVILLLEEWVGGAKHEMFFGTFQFVRDRGQSLEDTPVLAVIHIIPSMKRRIMASPIWVPVLLLVALWVRFRLGSLGFHGGAPEQS